MQRSVFDQLGYTELARELRVPLVNLHTGELVEVAVPAAFVFEKTDHPSRAGGDGPVVLGSDDEDAFAGGGDAGDEESDRRVSRCDLSGGSRADARCGGRSGTVRNGVGDCGHGAGEPLGLTVIDGSTAMEGNGPTEGTLVPMNTIVAGTNPLATDMVAAGSDGIPRGGHPDVCVGESGRAAAGAPGRHRGSRRADRGCAPAVCASNDCAMGSRSARVGRSRDLRGARRIAMSAALAAIREIRSRRVLSRLKTCYRPG